MSTCLGSCRYQPAVHESAIQRTKLDALIMSQVCGDSFSVTNYGVGEGLDPSEYNAETAEVHNRQASAPDQSHRLWLSQKNASSPTFGKLADTLFVVSYFTLAPLIAGQLQDMWDTFRSKLSRLPRRRG